MKQLSSFFPRKVHPLGLVLALAGGFQARAQDCTAPVTDELINTGVVDNRYRCAKKVGDPTIEGFDPAIAMANYLCRSFDMIEFAKFNWQSTGYVYNGRMAGGQYVGDAINYNLTATSSPPSFTYNKTSLGPPGFPEYNFADNVCYHPSTYAKCIKMLVDLNARILTRVSAASFGMEAVFFDNLQDASGDYLKDADGNYIPRIYSGRNNESSYYYVCKQAVIDINAAYDTRGLRRPIIQAGVLENVAYGNAAAINTVHIDTEVLADFADEIALIPGPQAVRDYYNASSHPQFTLSNISKNSEPSTIDITKLEARMLMYQEATAFIRMGYKSLHMGIYWSYASGDTGYQLTYKLFNKIRGYARKRGTFVLLMGENAGSNIPAATSSVTNDNGTSAKLTPPNSTQRSDELLFDFDGRAMRPREYFSGSTPPSGSPIGNYVGDINNAACSGAFNQVGGVQVAVPPTLCSGVGQAVIDPCVIENVGGSVGGSSPVSRTMEDPTPILPTPSLPSPPRATYPGLSASKHYEQVPYYVYFDFGDKAWSDNGIYDKPNPEDASTYGYEDTKWFGQKISSACRLQWLRTYYADRRKFHKGFGYVQIPGILILKTPEVIYGSTPIAKPRPLLPTYSASNPSPSGFPYLYPNNLPSSTDGKYVMANEATDFIASIKELLAPKPVEASHILIKEIQYDIVCANCPATGTQMAQIAHKYIISVENPDVSSTYTIHISGPNYWLPYTYGTTREIVNFEPGSYTIYVRQDNPGLNSVESGNNYTVEGVKQVSVPANFKAPICRAACSNRALSTTENTKFDEITISPVPAKGVITVALQTAQAGPVTLIVRNALGQVLKSQKLSVAAGANAARMDLSGQATGMYYLEVQRSTGSSFHKFLLE